MTRAILLASLLLGACTVGEVNTNQGVNPGAPDAPAGSGSDPVTPDAPGSTAAACINRGTPGTAHQHAGAGGSTHAGEACLNAACHASGGAGPQFQFAGTIYKKGTTTADPGVNIVITPGNAAITPLKLISDDAGNFSIGVTQGAMPASTMATACPDITIGHAASVGGAPLSGQTTPGKGGDCNACHGVGQATISTN